MTSFISGSRGKIEMLQSRLDSLVTRGNSNDEEIAMVLDSGADINSRNGGALLNAMYHRNKEVIRILVSRGISLDFTDLSRLRDWLDSGGGSVHGLYTSNISLMCNGLPGYEVSCRVLRDAIDSNRRAREAKWLTASELESSKRQIAEREETLRKQKEERRRAKEEKEQKEEKSNRVQADFRAAAQVDNSTLYKRFKNWIAERRNRN